MPERLPHDHHSSRENSIVLVHSFSMTLDAHPTNTDKMQGTSMDRNNTLTTCRIPAPKQ